MKEFDKFQYHPVYAAVWVFAVLICIPAIIFKGGWIIGPILYIMQVSWVKKGFDKGYFKNYTFAFVEDYYKRYGR